MGDRPVFYCTVGVPPTGPEASPGMRLAPVRLRDRFATASEPTGSVRGVY